MNRISQERISELDKLAELIQQHELTEVIFICTHNSRRSQFAQVAFQIACLERGLNINVFSGGTEETSLNENALAAMQDAGIKIEKDSGLGEGYREDNPIYILDVGEKSMKLFSKKYDHEINPKENFLAVMVCEEADAECPFVPGAKVRFSLPYQDPKHSDGSNKEAEVYSESFKNISLEMNYLAEQIAEQ